MKEIFNKYMNNDLKIEKSQKISIICSVIVLSGIFGWVYEFIFYFFNSGMKEFYWRGGNFLPWINIYATGSLIIMFFTKKLRKRPLLVFLISVFSTGILEYFSGFMIFKLYNLRFWDYNTEILNFLNIGGFVCLRSVGFFGLSALFLTYCLVPFCIYLSYHFNKKTFLIVSVSICCLFLFDELYNLIFSRLFDLPRAHDIYEKIGFNFMNYH